MDFFETLNVYRKGRILWPFVFLIAAAVVFNRYDADPATAVIEAVGAGVLVLLAGFLVRILLAVHEPVRISYLITRDCRPGDALPLIEQALRGRKPDGTNAIALRLDQFAARVLEGDVDAAVKDELAFHDAHRNRIDDAPLLAYAHHDFLLRAALHRGDRERASEALVARRASFVQMKPALRKRIASPRREEHLLGELLAKLLLVGDEEAACDLTNFAKRAKIGQSQAESWFFLRRHHLEKGNTESAYEAKKKLFAMCGTYYYLKDLDCSPWFGTNRSGAVRRITKVDTGRAALAWGALSFALVAYGLPLFWGEIQAFRTIGVVLFFLILAVSVVAARKGPALVAGLAIVLMLGIAGMNVFVTILGGMFGNWTLDTEHPYPTTSEALITVEANAELGMPGRGSILDFDCTYGSFFRTETVYRFTYQENLETDAFSDAVLTDERWITYYEALGLTGMSTYGMIDLFGSEDMEHCLFYDVKAGTFNEPIDMTDGFEYYFIHYDVETKDMTVVVYYDPGSTAE